jgi:hypothetical protein
MERFVRCENIKHYRELLKTVNDEAERQRIQKLLAEELQKAKDAGDKIEEE